MSATQAIDSNHGNVRSAENVLAAMPNSVQLLTRNLAGWILEEQEYRRRGCRFIILIPEEEVL